jgi:ABC-2 type transport system ATP-binding protein
MTQETVVERDLTARQNLELFARLYHVPAAELDDRVKSALHEAELTEFADKKAGSFSGGMQRRLELVKSMIQEPKILVLDEPTTGLDVQNRVRMWDHIGLLRKNGVTVILTTQYLEEADVLCDRIAIIDHGKIKALGTPSELKRIVGTGRILEVVVEIGNSEKTANFLKKEFGLNATYKNEKVTAPMIGYSSKVLSKILLDLEKKEIDVSSVSVRLPTLDDVFIKLTGAQLRDSTGEQKSGTDQMIKRMH